MIVLDTSVLVDALSGRGEQPGELRATIADGHRIVLPALVLYEWLRGPRSPEELDAQEALFPSDSALPFGPDEAAVSARLYTEVGGARGREVDLAIASHAIVRNAAVWTANPADFRDLPGVELHVPARRP